MTRITRHGHTDAPSRPRRSTVGIQYVYWLTALIGLLSVSVASAQLASDCQNDGDLCQGKALARASALGSTRSFCVHVGAVGDCTLTTDATGWEVNAGESITLKYWSEATGATPPGSPDTIDIEIYHEDTGTLICSLHSGAEPTNGDTFTLHGTTDCTGTGTPASGTLRLFIEADLGGIGGYTVNSDGTGGDEDANQQGAIRGNIPASEVTLTASTPPAGSLFAYGPSGDESVTITATYPRPFLSATHQDLRIDIEAGGGPAVTGSTFDAEVDGSTDEVQVIDDSFDGVQRTYGASLNRDGDSTLTGVSWTNATEYAYLRGTFEKRDFEGTLLSSYGAPGFGFTIPPDLGPDGEYYGIFSNGTVASDAMPGPFTYGPTTECDNDTSSNMISFGTTNPWCAGELTGTPGAVRLWEFDLATGTTLQNFTVTNAGDRVNGFHFNGTDFLIVLATDEYFVLGEDGVQTVTGTIPVNDQGVDHHPALGWTVHDTDNDGLFLYNPDTNTVGARVSSNQPNGAYRTVNPTASDGQQVLVLDLFTADPRVSLDLDSCTESLYNRGETSSCDYSVQNARSEDVTRAVNVNIIDSTASTVDSQSLTGATKTHAYVIQSGDDAENDLVGAQWSLVPFPSDGYAGPSVTAFNVSSKLLLNSFEVASCSEDLTVLDDDGFDVVNREESHDFGYYLGFARCEPYTSQSGITQEVRDDATPTALEDSQTESTDGNGRIASTYTPSSTDLAAATTTGRDKLVRVTHNGNTASDSTEAWAVSSLYFIDAHVQIDGTLSKDDFPTEDSTEAFQFIIGADVSYGWCHVKGVRLDRDIDTAGGAAVDITWDDPDGNPIKTASQGTGMDGWTARTSQAAVAPSGTYTVTCEVSEDGNSGSDVEEIGFVSSFTENSYCRIVFLDPLTIGADLRVYCLVILNEQNTLPDVPPEVDIILINQTEDVVQVLARQEMFNVVNNTQSVNGSLYYANFTVPDSAQGGESINTVVLTRINGVINRDKSTNPVLEDSMGVADVTYGGLEWGEFIILLFWLAILAGSWWQGWTALGFVAFLASASVFLTTSPIAFPGFLFLALVVFFVMYAQQFKADLFRKRDD